VFRDEKALFLSAMDRTLTKIANLIARQLNAAKQRVREGLTKTRNAYGALDEETKKLSKDAFDFFTAQYRNLEQTVKDKQQELAEQLADFYKSNVDSLRDSFDKIKEEISKGWIGKAIDFVVDVAKAIAELADLLLTVLARLASLIGEILAHPIRFLNNLGAGIKAGFDQFIGRIDEFLLAGFFDWLRGSVSKDGVQLPQKLDARGLFELTSQILDINYQTFRQIAVRKFGEGVVSVLERGEEVAEAGLNVFRMVAKDGLGALWDHVSALVVSGLDETFKKIKETIFFETIKKALEFVGGLFVPAGAFIKAVQLLYRGLRFLVDNIDRISELVTAFLDSLAFAVKGEVGAIAGKIVLALRSFIVIAIDFLAKLLRLGNLGEKVRRVLNTLRRPIVRAMEWLLDRLKGLVRRVFKGRTAAKLRRGEAKAKGAMLSPRVVKRKIIAAMKKPIAEEDPSKALAEANSRAGRLKSQYQPKLERGTIKITILDKSADEVSSDGDVDIGVALSPGTKISAPIKLHYLEKKGNSFQLKPKYQGSFMVRTRFYGSAAGRRYTARALAQRDTLVAFLRCDRSGNKNPRGKHWESKSGHIVPLAKPTQPTIEHKPPVAKHWNDGDGGPAGRASDQAARRKWFSFEGRETEVKVLDAVENSRAGSGGVNFEPVVEKTWTGPGGKR
jgi:hypothetical protein